MWSGSDLRAVLEDVLGELLPAMVAHHVAVARGNQGDSMGVAGVGGWRMRVAMYNASLYIKVP